MKKAYIKPTIECVKVKVDSLLQGASKAGMSGDSQSNEQALGRGFFMDFNDDEVFEGSEE